MFSFIAKAVSRHWLLVILAWIAILIMLRPPRVLRQWGIPFLGAPAWDDITLDGDFAYMPADMPSVVGQRRLQEAFPTIRAKSQMVLILARENGTDGLTLKDHAVADGLAARFHNYHGIHAFRRGRALREEADARGGPDRREPADDMAKEPDRLIADAQAAFDEAIFLDDQFAEAFYNRAQLQDYLGEPETAAADRAIARQLNPDLPESSERLLPDDLIAPEIDTLPLASVWTRHTEIVGEKLRDKDNRAQLIILHLSNEFMAVQNIYVLKTVRAELNRVRRQLKAERKRLEAEGKQLEADRLRGLKLGISGNAAVGGDMLQAAAESIRNTELLTITLVIVILVLVYRSPLLVAIPLLTIFVSFVIATSVVAALTQLNHVPGFAWWDFNVFKTTRIFILVIMYGAGTDYCLFLISRYREELALGHVPREAIARALSGVGDALAASALTTILGLSMMFFADFGKYRNSGPAIGLCLVISLLAAITLAPAILRAFGKWVFWPFGVGVCVAKASDLPRDAVDVLPGRLSFLWAWLAKQIVTYPGRILVVALLFMLPVAWYGRNVGVTYDLLSALAPTRPSRRGTELLERHFPSGKGGTIEVLAYNDHGQFAEKNNLPAIEDLTLALYSVPGVRSVRSIAEPLGDKPKYTGVFDAKKRALRSHRLSRELVHAQASQWKGKLTRFELILEEDPFSIEAIHMLNDVESLLARVAAEPRPFWQETAGADIEDEVTAAELADRFEAVFAGTEFSYTGTTAALRDLRKVTQSDESRIKLLVVIAVFVVLLLILKRPLICIYMILSVLLSYYVTIGITELFFSQFYGDTFSGLDWKVPLFLFVILVAIGQDYNIYLATRVFEEQRRHGLREGLRRAVLLTGGIITSCGVIMAGTLVSMASGTLRTMVELGFALSLGVIIDTFIVRPILVPAFIALLARFGKTSVTPEKTPLDGQNG